MDKPDLLRHLSFGSRVAEEEIDDLRSYFVETHQWEKIFHDSVDIVYGPKGSGKSALYFLLLSRLDDLFDRNIILIPAENLRGAPVFRDLVSNPPTTELEFVSLWKLYMLSLAAQSMREYGVINDSSRHVVRTLEYSGFLKKANSLRNLLRDAIDYVRPLLRPDSVEGGVAFDPDTGMPVGFTGKITLREPTSSQRQLGFTSIDELIDALNQSLEEASYHIWLVIDRLDVAFSDNHDLETNALRGLFKMYLDMLAHPNISVKIFLRSDIWRRITRSGFREASHITRAVDVTWDRTSLLNIVIKRIAKNDRIIQEYDWDLNSILTDIDKQENSFEQIFPEQVEIGINKPRTFDWMLGRTRDGTGTNAPRELIHLLTAARDVQLGKLEVGEREPPNGKLFGGAAIKEALAEVSRVRLEQTLYAEYPEWREYLEKMQRQKTEQQLATLEVVWETDSVKSRQVADELVEIGFFERRGTREQPAYWVPFIYRDALQMIQGKAEVAQPGLEPPFIDDDE
jgi:hypothetical protein